MTKSLRIEIGLSNDLCEMEPLRLPIRTKGQSGFLNRGNLINIRYLILHKWAHEVFPGFYGDAIGNRISICSATWLLRCRPLKEIQSLLFCLPTNQAIDTRCLTPGGFMMLWLPVLLVAVMLVLGLSSQS